MGKVGINTDYPTEALSVQGNIQLTGQVLQPSDIRIKEKIKELDTRTQLDNVKKIKIVQYNYKEEYVEHLPDEQKPGNNLIWNTYCDVLKLLVYFFTDLSQKPQTGVIAQEVMKVIPEAVTTAGDFPVNSGANKIIEDMLIVNKDRLFLGT